MSFVTSRRILEAAAAAAACGAMGCLPHRHCPDYSFNKFDHGDAYTGAEGPSGTFADKCAHMMCEIAMCILLQHACDDIQCHMYGLLELRSAFQNSEVVSR